MGRPDHRAIQIDAFATPFGKFSIGSNDPAQLPPCVEIDQISLNPSSLLKTMQIAATAERRQTLAAG